MPARCAKLCHGATKTHFQTWPPNDLLPNLWRQRVPAKHRPPSSLPRLARNSAWSKAVTSILLPHQLITSGICSPAASRPGSVHKGKAPPQRGPRPHSDITQLQHLKQRLVYVKHLAPHTSKFHCLEHNLNTYSWVCHTGYDLEVKFETTLCLNMLGFGEFLHF